ncbi:MAG: hypothetical protein HQ546_07295 [Planctomycetes bacterium]|nr:hypothetical protein [Planctomycetota bacterium]
MRTPDDWREQMMKTEETRSVLSNVDAERCVSADRELAFSDGLRTRGPFTLPDEAWEAAKTVVKEDHAQFLCHGRTVPNDRFKRAVRFLRPEKWTYLVASDHEQKRIRRHYGLHAVPTLGALSVKQRASLVADLSSQELRVGKPNMIVWVAECETVSWRSGGLRNILRRLGLLYYKADNLTFVLEYDKAIVGRPLHVPRAFDGIGSWPFELQVRCDSEVGMTWPLDMATPGETGYPEAVHRSGCFRVNVVDLRTIDDGPSDIG